MMDIVRWLLQARQVLNGVWPCCYFYSDGMNILLSLRLPTRMRTYACPPLRSVCCLFARDFSFNLHAAVHLGRCIPRLSYHLLSVLYTWYNIEMDVSPYANTYAGSHNTMI